MSVLNNLLVLILIFNQGMSALLSDEISFLILSQKNSYHAGIAENLKQNIVEQSINIKKNTTPNVYLSHQTFDKNSEWAITPILIDILQQLIQPKTKWFILCDTNSVINLKSLLIDLDNEDYKTETYLGYPLFDRDATIIHHFAFFRNPSQFLFPYIKAGVAFSIPLLNRLADHLILATKSSETPSNFNDFSIDAAHELSLFIWNIDNSLKLKPVPYFCSSFKEECSIYARNENIFCENPVSLDKILFGVKTCQKFHNERLPVILKTWAQYTIHLRIFSDVGDSSIPTISTGVENTENGHCEKSLQILKNLLDEITKNSTLKSIEWIILADDDTILSISSLSEYLGCFDRNDHIYLGERYGYNLFSQDNGYNYITGGGGIVFNLKSLKKLVKSCSCPSISSPDDMIISSCLKQHKIHPIHSSLFHQARPNDYSSDIIDKNSISFHKFWQINPYEIYKKFFHRRDEEYYRLNKNLLTECKLQNSNRDEYKRVKSIKNVNQNINQRNIKHIEL